MATNLSEEHRQKLDSIVMQMEANGESEDDIRFVVGDFKNKYSSPEKQPAQPEESNKWLKAFLPEATEKMSQTAPSYDYGYRLPGSYISPNNPSKELFTDISGIPIRGAGVLLDPVLPGKQAEGEGFLGKMSDPEAGILRPVGERMQAIQNDPEASQFVKFLAKGGEITSDILEDLTVVKALVSKIPRMGEMMYKSLAKPGNVISSGARAGADKVQFSIINPKQGAMKEGFDIKNVFKHDVAGSIDEVLKKTTNKIQQKAGELRKLIKQGDSPDIDVDIQGLLNKTYKEVSGNPEENAELIMGGKGAFKKLSELLKKFKGTDTMDPMTLNMRKKTIGLEKAQKIKQALGLIGSWEHIANQQRAQISESASAVSKLASKLYLKLKKEIEDIAPDGLQEINRDISELIPIKNAATARKLVADRNNPISLNDVIALAATIGTGGKALPLMLAVRLQKMGATAKGLDKIAEKLMTATDPADIKRYTDVLTKKGITRAEIQALRSVVSEDPNPPEPGAEMEGYRFKGGDPSKKENWEKL